MIQGRIITLVLFGVNLVVFICMIANGDSPFEPTTESILNWGGNESSLTFNGGWWRLITSCFVHIGIFHLIGNLYYLYYIGSYLEPILGKSRFILSYLSTGIFAGMASLLANKYSYTVSAGASGAIFGMFGVFVALLSTKLIPERIRNSCLQNTLIFIAYNLIFGRGPGIDSAAHVGGLLSGLVIGYCLYPSLSLYFQSEKVKAFTNSFLLLASTLAATGFLINGRNSPSFQFDKVASEFANNIEHINSLIDNIKQTSKIETLMYMYNHLNPEYEKIKILAEKATTIKLKDDKAKRRDYMVKYIHLISERYELLAKGIRENTSKYDMQIDEINKKLTQLSFE